jgi:hypothetical protein
MVSHLALASVVFVGNFATYLIYY